MARISILGAIAATLLLVGGCGGGKSDESTSSVRADEITDAERSPSGSGNSTTDKPYRGGEKSIEEFGHEATGPDRSTLLATFHGYFGALAAGDRRRACTYLAAVVNETLEQVSTDEGKGLDCAQILPKLLHPSAARIAREQNAGRVTKVRVEGDRAFVVFHAPGAKLYQLTMVREGGEWKTTTLSSAVLVPSPASLGLGH